MDALESVAKPFRKPSSKTPSGWPIMYQTWDQLLFLHWAVDVSMIEHLIPRELEIDTWDGAAWIGVTPFTIYHVRPPLLPPLPLLSRTHELNVRTYVSRDNVPGVWFFSLDASNPLAVWGARLGFSLPYFHARMQLKSTDERISFNSERVNMPAALFQATWQTGARLPNATPGTREYFLLERYHLYSNYKGQLLRSDIKHRPWPLCTARVELSECGVLAADGLQMPIERPLIHAQAEPLHVGIWRPKTVYKP